jgi:hypothetical protein
MRGLRMCARTYARTRAQTRTHPCARSRIHPQVTHCGINSVHEAAWYGVPVVCAPIMADQIDNSKFVTAVGTGADLQRPLLDGGDVQAAAAVLTQVATNARYAAAARAAARLLRAHARLPMQQAADWVEFALGSGLQPGALLPSESRLPWWQTVMVDCIALAAAAVALAGWLTFAFWRCVWRAVTRRCGPEGRRAGARHKAE